MLTCSLSLGLSGCAGSSASNVPQLPVATRWLLVSDVHFTPYDDPGLVKRLVQEPVSNWHAILASSPNPPSPYFKDTNFALLESALAAMRSTLPDPPVVVIGGDFMGHYFPEQFAKLVPNAPPAVYYSFVDKTMAFLASEFNAAYPRAQFLITLGNNDGYCGDYQSTPNSPFLAHMARAWLPLVNRNRTAPNFRSDFSVGGYYTGSLLSQSRITAIALNSVFWSSLYTNACGVSGIDPGSSELNWLATTLSTPSLGRPLLLTHIPPGIDEYASIKNGKPTPLYKESYTQQLLALLKAKAQPRAFVLGHIHHATFEITDTSEGQIGAFVIPSISPNQGNNPAFMTAIVQAEDPTIVDTTTYVLQLASMTGWMRLYSFNEAYGLQAFDAPNLLKLQGAMVTNLQVRNQFFENYNSASATATPSPEKWRWYWCGHTNLTPPPYATCLGQGQKTP
jgi:hypothetical protein